MIRRAWNGGGRRIFACPRRPFALAVMACMGTMAWSQGARGQVVELETLEEAALERHEAVKRAEARAHGAQAAVAGARSAYYPSVTFTTEGSISPGNELIEVVTPRDRRFLVRGSQPLGQPRAFVAIPRYGATVSVDALLYDFGRTAGTVDAAEAEAGAARAEAQSEGRRVVQMVRQAYLDWLTAHALERMAEEALDDSDALRERTEGRAEEGVLPPAAATAARHQVAEARLELAQAQERTLQARARVVRATGLKLPDEARPDRRLLDEPSEADPPGEADVEVMRRQREAAMQRAETRERVRAPVIRAGLMTGVMGQLDTVFPSYSVGLTFAVPLWDGGEGKAEAAVQRAEAAEMTALMEEERRVWRLMVEHGERMGRKAGERASLAAAAESLARERLAQVTEQYELGAVGHDAVARARAAVRRARAEVLEAKVTRAAAALGLLGVP